MGKKKVDEYLDGSDIRDESDTPAVKEIILPPSLYQHALRRGYQTYNEVGFYLIGLFKNQVCYIHDLLEFDYSEQSGGFIESGMARYVRLKAGLPLGLHIVGHMHKHPGFTQFSATDKRNFLRYGNANPLNAFLIYIVDPHEEIRGYTATAERIFPVKIHHRELSPEEELVEKEICVEFSTKVLLPKKSTYSDFHFLFSEKISSEILKFFSRPTFQISSGNINDEADILADAQITIRPRKAVEIKGVGNNKRLQYRIFMEENEKLAALTSNLKELVELPEDKRYEIRLYEEGRELPQDMKVKEISHPVTWQWEISAQYLILKNFLMIWDEVIKILKAGGEDLRAEPSRVENKLEERPPMSSEPLEKTTNPDKSRQKERKKDRSYTLDYFT